MYISAENMDRKLKGWAKVCYGDSDEDALLNC